MQNNPQNSFEINDLQPQIYSLVLYQGLFKQNAGKFFLEFLSTLEASDQSKYQCLKAYGEWFQALAKQQQSWQDYLITAILQDENPFSNAAQEYTFEDIPLALIKAAKQDLKALQNLSAYRAEQICEWIERKTGYLPVSYDQQTEEPTILHQSSDWTEVLEALAQYYQQRGTGIFAQYKAFRWQSNQLVGIKHPDPIQLLELTGYENQRAALLQNTEMLLAGYRALNILLYGSRGSGKSSLVKSLLHHYENLRLIEVGKAQLAQLPEIVEGLREVPQKFIIFVDDLSFEEDDEAFKALKVVLEGSLTARPQNVVVYATSNRRHLVREFFSDRPRPKDQEEIQAWDTLQEKLSFSDRFGLTLTFEPADQDTYLQIVQHLAQLAEIDLPWEDIRAQALQWATRHNGRSGRTARQFIDFLEGKLKLANSSPQE